MDSVTWSNYLESAPESAQAYLFSRQSGDNAEAAQTKLAYDNDAWDRVMDVVWDAVFAKLSQADFKERIRRLAGDRKPEDVERAVLFQVVLPLADLVSWDVDARLGELGVAQADIHGVARVSLRPVSYGAAVRRIAAQAKLSILSEELIRRLREIFVSFVKGVRTVEQVKEMLQRPQGEGGIGLSQAQADQFVATMQSFLSTTRVLSEQEYADWLTNRQREEERQAASGKRQAGDQVAGRPAQRDPVSRDGSQVGEDAGTQSIAPVAPRVADRMATALEQAIQSAVAEIKLTQPDEFLAKRLRNIVSTRMRDVRSALEVKAVLQRDQHVGGMGLAAAEAERVAQIIETTYAAHHQTIENEEKKSIEAVQAEQKLKIEERKKRESEEHAKWFQEKVAGMRGEEALRAVMRPPVRQERGNAGTQGAAPPVIPTVDSIKPPEVHLTGLAEELGGMTAEQFRRLAKTPEQAADKVKQKLATLKAESFERWTAGVEAWRRSPLQQQYLKLVATSFAAGRPVAELVEEKRRQDPNAISAAEVAALVALNSQLQF